MNRLIHEHSPYLLQHADNPVDWYPWGEEAFRAARESDRPVFLSIGYSTCHWCHVMARESFYDAQIAGLLNQYFIAVKVDREERPDIDGLYMKVCQMLTGGGGWPLTVFMTPDRKPFFAGTYFPRESRFGQIGMLQLLPQIDALWRQRRGELIGSAERIVAALEADAMPLADADAAPYAGADSVPPPAARPEDATSQLIDKAYEELRLHYDPIYGGFGETPKFPRPHTLSFLLRYWRRTGASDALEMVEKTLTAMRNGGLYDQIGGGVHRYATDRAWIIPHFEKMLYDQALLAVSWLEAFQATGETDYGRTAREILRYALGSLRSPEGGFYCAEDAESEGREGKFYLWTEEEIAGALDPETAALIASVFNIRGNGNFAEERTRRLTGENILYRTGSLRSMAGKMNMSATVLEEKVEAALRILFGVRATRIRPKTDDKVLTDWNGLMIAALARGAQVFGERDLLKGAADAAQFVLKRLRLPDGRLLHRWRDEAAGVPGFLDDYAFLIWGLLEVYEAGFDASYLRTAISLAETMIEDFWDRSGGGFFFTSSRHETLPVRRKEIQDGALPSGNSVAMLDLLKLGALTGLSAFMDKAARLERAFSGEAERMPSAYTYFLMALDFAAGPAHEVLISGPREAPLTKDMLRAVQSRFLPNKVVLLRPVNGESEEIAEIAEFTKDLPSSPEETAAYVCTAHSCQAPVKTTDELLKLLG